MSSRPASVVVSSRVSASVEDVWAHASTMDGVNAELAPFVSMSVPPAFRGVSLDEAPLGRVAFVSVLRLFGVVPFDRHALMLVSVSAPSGFSERSTSALQRRWDHDRTIVADGAGALVTDRVTFCPRVGPAWVVRPVVYALFRHRHRRLGRLVGGAPSGPSH